MIIDWGTIDSPAETGLMCNWSQNDKRARYTCKKQHSPDKKIAVAFIKNVIHVPSLLRDEFRYGNRYNFRWQIPFLHGFISSLFCNYTTQKKLCSSHKIVLFSLENILLIQRNFFGIYTQKNIWLKQHKLCVASAKFYLLEKNLFR